METLTYSKLNINQRINFKGYHDQKARHFGTRPRGYVYIAWIAWDGMDINPKLANELLFFRSTPRGYAHY
jgi:hypothetical protein